MKGEEKRERNRQNPFVMKILLQIAEKAELFPTPCFVGGVAAIECVESFRRNRSAVVVLDAMLRLVCGSLPASLNGIQRAKVSVRRNASDGSADRGPTRNYLRAV
jgi:hypothetical protein